MSRWIHSFAHGEVDPSWLDDGLSSYTLNYAGKAYWSFRPSSSKSVTDGDAIECGIRPGTYKPIHDIRGIPEDYMVYVVFSADSGLAIAFLGEPGQEAEYRLVAGANISTARLMATLNRELYVWKFAQFKTRAATNKDAEDMLLRRLRACATFPCTHVVLSRSGDKLGDLTLFDHTEDTIGEFEIPWGGQALYDDVAETLIVTTENVRFRTRVPTQEFREWEFVSNEPSTVEKVKFYVTNENMFDTAFRQQLTDELNDAIFNPVEYARIGMRLLYNKHERVTKSFKRVFNGTGDDWTVASVKRPRNSQELIPFN